MPPTGKEDATSEKKHMPPSKVIIRRLPPTMTEAELLEQISPLPDNNYVKFVPADFSLSPWAYSRAYINFVNPDDIVLFRDRFNGYVFVDVKGNEFPALVEFAPWQKRPVNRSKKDPKCGTIDDDPDYKTFLEELKNPKQTEIPTLDATLAEIEKKEKELKDSHGGLKVKTPLIEFIQWRKEERYKRQQEKRRQREEERQRREEERKKRIEREKREALRKQKEKEKELAKKVASRPERAPRFEKKNRDAKQDEDYDYNDNNNYPSSKSNKGYKGRGGGGGKYDDVDQQSSSSYGDKKTANKDDQYDQNYDDYPTKKYPEKKHPQTEKPPPRNYDEKKVEKGRGPRKWRGNDADYYDEAPPKLSGRKKETSKDYGGADETKKPAEPSNGGGSGKEKNKSERYKDKPSIQLYQPGKNRRVVESQEKPLVFKDPKEENE